MKFDEIRKAFVFGSAPIFEGKSEIEARAPYITHINNISSMRSRHSSIAKDISAYGGAGTSEWNRHNEADAVLGDVADALHKGDEKIARKHYSRLDWNIRNGHKTDTAGSHAWTGPHSVKNTSIWLDKK